MRKQLSKPVVKTVPDLQMARDFVAALGFKLDGRGSARAGWFSVRSAQGYQATRALIDKLVAAGLIKSTSFHQKRWSSDSYAEGYSFKGYGMRRMIWLSYPGMRSEKITINLSSNYSR